MVVVIINIVFHDVRYGFDLLYIARRFIVHKPQLLTMTFVADADYGRSHCRSTINAQYGQHMLQAAAFDTGDLHVIGILRASRAWGRKKMSRD